MRARLQSRSSERRGESLKTPAACTRSATPHLREPRRCRRHHRRRRRRCSRARAQAGRWRMRARVTRYTHQRRRWRRRRWRRRRRRRRCARTQTTRRNFSRISICRPLACHRRAYRPLACRRRHRRRRHLSRPLVVSAHFACSRRTAHGERGRERARARGFLFVVCCRHRLCARLARHQCARINGDRLRVCWPLHELAVTLNRRAKVRM